jgi:predicted permease
VGVIGILAELVAHLWFDRKADPTLILVFAAMLGLTGFLGQREEEKKPG